MQDIIRLLPDHIANQIAAGEVIQRPSSAIKELLENAIDARATEIKLIVNDAGKSLVQVIDNGHGMSVTDARMAFERHATSKISSIEDLFHIRTMGFRGEALASIAAVSQVELRTRKAEDELGVCIEIDSSKVTSQEPVSHPVGTSIAMKNLFFNVPARRNFLKSNTTELRNIIEEFTRIALANPSIQFSLQSNGQQVFMLEKGNLKQRIVQLISNKYKSFLIPINEQNDYLAIHGFVGKPEIARKIRGEQYFFVNNRFIKSAYLNHAVTSAFEDLLPRDSFPSYFLFIELDPSQIDINVHPSKQEIKFTDEKLAYAFVQAGVKHALAQFSIAPSLDFSLNSEIQQLDAIQQPLTSEKIEQIAGNDLYRTFTQKHQAHKLEPAGLKTTEDNSGVKSGWQSELAKIREQYFESSKTIAAYSELEYEQQPYSRENRFNWLSDAPMLQLHGTYIIAVNNQGFMLIHQQAAHERVIYERLGKAIHGKPMATQKSLFPVSFQLQPTDAMLLMDIIPDLHVMGYHVESVAENGFTVQGTPADVEAGNEKKMIEQILEQYSNFSSDIKFSKREKLIRTLAWQQSIKPGRILSEKEMKMLAEQLFMCSVPNATPNGNPTYITYQLNQLEKLFGKS